MTGRPVIGADRLAFVDVMRSIAVGRVVINHALPWPWMKWFESLPVMFFASGTLVGRSLQHRGWRAVLLGRFQRLALPTGVYLGFCVVLALTNLQPWTVTTVHLWYVWTFLAFTAISPLFRWLIRRSSTATLTVMAVLVVMWTLLDLPETAVGVAYALAWVAGMVWAERDCVVPSRRFLLTTAAVGAAAAVVSVQLMLGIEATISPSTIGIAMAGLGAAWLAIGMLARAQLEALMHVRGVGRFIRYMNHRLLTVYLWHIPPTFAGRQWSAELGLRGVWSVLFVLAVTFAGTALATVAFGGLEDRASVASKRVKARAVGYTGDAVHPVNPPSTKGWT